MMKAQAIIISLIWLVLFPQYSAVASSSSSPMKNYPPPQFDMGTHNDLEYLTTATTISSRQQRQQHDIAPLFSKTTTLLPSLGIAILSVLVCLVARESPTFFTALDRLEQWWYMHFGICILFLVNFWSAANSSSSISTTVKELNFCALAGACRTENGTIVPQAQEIITTIRRYIRLLVVLSFNKNHRRKWVLEQQKQQQLGFLITNSERQLLQQVPPSDRPLTVASWLLSIITKSQDGFRSDMPVAEWLVNRVCRLLVVATKPNLVSRSLPWLRRWIVSPFLIVTPFAAVAQLQWWAVVGSTLLSLLLFGWCDWIQQLALLDNDDKDVLESLLEESSTGWNIPPPPKREI